ncbi:brain tumor protein [Sergentomyia squamirostris]
MATSPTPSLDSLPGATNSLRSFGEHTDYLSDSPLTLSGSSPTVSDSAICDDFPLNGLESSAPSSQTPSSSERSSTCPRCTGCKSKQLDAVAKCIDCANYLCSNCVTAHQFMHCFDGHSVFRIGSDGQLQATTSSQQQQQLHQHLDIMNGFDSHRFGLKDETSLLNKANNVSSLLSGNSGSIGTTTVSSGLSSLLVDGGGLLGATTSKANSYFCTRHKSELLKFYCRTCSVTVCKDCIVSDHPSGLHDCEHVNDGTPKQIESLLQLVADVRGKASDMRAMVKNAEHNTARIQVQYHKAQTEINETHNFYRSLLDDRKQDLLKELESFYNAKTLSQSVLMTKSQEHIDKVLQSCEFVERLTKHAGLAETIMLRKLMENKLQSFMGYIQDLQSTYELEFVSNYQAIQVGVRNTFGYIRSSSEAPTKQPPIARPTSNSILTNGSSPTSSTGSLNMNIAPPSNHMLSNGCHAAIERPFSNGGSTSIMQAATQPPSQSAMSFDSNIISKRFNSVNSLGPFVGDVNIQVNPYEKWSNGGSDNIFNSLSDQYTIPLAPSQNATDSVIDLTSKLMSTSIFPPKSQIKRQKMIYHCKFGEFGVMEGQFTEPSGVAVNAQNDIIVADTNNHRIQIFDKEGRFKFQFGECGKRDGQLLYPNRVAVVRTSGDIIVTERSPTHQIQIYNQYGQFVRKFGANILQHPRGVTVDNKGRIIVVECKVMRVIIFDQSGNVLQKFGCSKHLEFPNGVVVNDKQEIFISDNRAHCVKVFNYEGVFLRQIGGEGITNYPIGVGINAAGEILIADNHNNFNLTIFTQDGQLVSALESKVKHAQCFDVALMDDGSVVLASKDYRLYIYRYVQVPPLGL